MSWPILRSASAVLYPCTITISFSTIVKQMQSAAQQRWPERPGLVKLDLPFQAMTQAEKNTQRTAFSTAKGRFATNIDVTFNGVTYPNLAIDEDEYAATEANSTQYDNRLKLKQAITGQFSPGSKGAAFPTLANGALGQLPYTQKKRYQTTLNDMAAGPRYSYAWFAAGLTGLPADGLLAWELDERNLSDTDLATRVNHFVNNWGRCFGFDFTDEDGTVYHGVHYAADELAINYVGPNNAGVKLLLEQTN